jgi:hypothetical protein
MAESKCTGNCMVCTVFQRQYCASQLAYSNMRMLELMQQTITEIGEKIETIQNNEATLINPSMFDASGEQQPTT